MEVVRSNSYERDLKRLRKLGAALVDLDRMERDIAANPEAGAVIPGSGGLRKARFAYGQVGKSGGGRTIYYLLTSRGVIYLVAAYAKVDKSDLTAGERKLFRTIIEEFKHDRSD